MSDINALISRIDNLAARLEHLENQRGVSSSSGGASVGGNAADNLSYCSQPIEPERQFSANVSPGRQSLIQVLSSKWVNGTVLS